MKNCQYQSSPNGKDTGRRFCALGWYGGKPWLGNCLDCMKRGDNTPEAKAAFDARADKAHPATAERVSGCCDSARNYNDAL